MFKTLIARLSRYVSLVCLAIVLLTFILIPFKILGYGFVPLCDARRHVAQAVSGHPYTGTIVMRPGYTMDHSPGWGWILNRLHAAGWETDALMSFSVVSMMLALFLLPLPFTRRPEAWMAALFVMAVTVPIVLLRWTQARPLMFVEGALAVVLLAWSRARTPSIWTMVWTAVLIGMAVWIHGAWYLWALPVAAVAMVGWRAAALRLGACCAAGIAFGALLTGHPVVFLKQAFFLASVVSKQNVPSWMLVGELQPGWGEFSVLLVIAVVLLWRVRRRAAGTLVMQPAFALMVIAWILGLHVHRFWEDWGVPAFLVWLTLQFEDEMTSAWDGQSLRRVACAGLVAVPMFFQCGNDLERRYSRSLDDYYLNGSDPALKSWLPEPGGIFYTVDMNFFYNSFYANPHAPWRYIIGFETALMPEEDLKVFRTVARRNFVLDSYDPWVRKLRDGDRLEITISRHPEIDELEWINAGGQVWIGKKRGSSPQKP